MNAALFVAGVLAVAAGLAHSYMGERMILIPLFRGDGVPASRFGRVQSTRVMIRFSWHFFTVVVWSTAALFLAISVGVLGGDDWAAIRVLAAYWAVFAVVVLALSRGRHFAWLLGSGVTVAAWWGTL
jgi:hypothetical protein